MVTEQQPKAPPHFVGVYWRHFWNGQRFTRTHLFRDYPERGYQNVDPSEGKSICGETIPDYYRTVDPRCDPCRRCARIAKKLLEKEAS